VRELSLHILDALENSIEAGATRIELLIEENLKSDTLTIVIKDNGRGMTEEFARQVLDPFVTTRTTRHVGLGLPLFAAAARRCNGDLHIQSTPSVGTTLMATFQHSHIDRAPLGDIVSSLIAVLMSESPVDIHYQHRVDERSFELDTEEVRRELGNVPLSHPLVREWLESVLAEGLASLQRLAPQPTRETGRIDFPSNPS
jgi:anti-sigma regulatory factor (Ser/Thr protein kinase)